MKRIEANDHGLGRRTGTATKREHVALLQIIASQEINPVRRASQFFIAASLSLLALAGQAKASGYRVPEQSLNSVATASASIAGAAGADSAYFNPAAMSWLDKERWHGEGDLLYINLPHITYRDNSSAARNGSSKTEEFLLPALHTVSPEFNGMRFGFSLVYPAGLSKRWADPFPRTFSEDFTLRVIEANPSLAFKLSDTLAVAGGLRLLKASGQVRSMGTTVASQAGPIYATISRAMEGDALAFGYNLAASWRPAPCLAFAATYRSRVDLDLEGDATLSSSAGFLSDGTPVPHLLPAGSYSGQAGVSAPVPAVLTLGAAWTFGKSTIEFTWDRTFWDAYQQLDFTYPAALGHPVLTAAFDNPLAKRWVNTDAFRLSLTQRLSNSLTLRLGLALDGNPVPDETLGFELPDANGRTVAGGLRYRLNDRLDAGFAYLYTDKRTRSVDQTATGGSINGTFTGTAAHMLALGLNGRF